MTTAPRLPHRSRHRRLARHRLCHRARARARPARMSSRWRARRAGSKNSTTRSEGRRRQRDAGAARPHRLRRHRPARRARCTSATASSTFWSAMPASPAPPRRSAHIELKPWDDVMAVNVTANFQLIRCMEPLLQKSDAGRAVFVTSGAREQGRRLSRALCGLEGRARDAGAGLGQRDRRRRRCASICSTPARSAPACAPIVMPGEDPMTLDTPEQVRGIHRADVPAGLHANRRGLFVSGQEDFEVSRSGVRADPHAEERSNARVSKDETKHWRQVSSSASPFRRTGFPSRAA